MRKQKYMIFLIFLLVLFIGLTIISNKKQNINYILSTKEYSYLPKEAQNFIEDTYNETGELVLTEKNKRSNEPYLNPSYVRYLSLSEEEREKEEIIPLPTIVDYYDDSKIDNDTYASSYDLRNVGGKKYITPLRDQGSSGICWAFTSAEHLESHIMKTTNKPYTSSTQLIAESQIDYASSSNGISDYTNEYTSYHSSRLLNRGGNFSIATEVMANGISLVNYSSFSFGTTKKELSDVLNHGNSLYEVNSTVDMPYLDSSQVSATVRSNYINKVKEYIMTYGGAYGGTSSPQSGCAYYDSKLKNYVIDVDEDCEYSGHAMEIIGWNDSIEYSYCKSDSEYHSGSTSTCPAEDKVTGRGVWILRNSWGENSGYDYPYLAYDSLETDIGFITSITSKSNRTWDNNYILKDPAKEHYGYRKVEYNLSNTRIRGNELLEQVKFNSMSSNATYTITIKTANNTTKTFTKTTEFPGLVTLDLSTNNITVNSNSTISITSTNGYAYSSFYVFTKNVDTLPFINLGDFTLTKSNQRLYSETKNIPSNSLIIYKLFNELNEDLSSYLTVSNNKVAINNVNTLIKLNETLPAGQYKFQATYNNNVLATKTFTVYASLSGAGTVSNPYKISNAMELYALNNSDINDKYFEITNDIDLTNLTRENGNFYNEGLGWKPIEGFSGYLNGNQHTIKGLYINNSSTTTNTGLFANLNNGGTIENLILENFEINGYKNSGALVGEIKSNNSSLTTKIQKIAIRNSKIKASNNYVGSLIGNITVSGSPCMNILIDNIFMDSIVNGSNYVGGIVGFVSGNTNTIKLTNLEILGNIVGGTYKGSVTSSSKNAIIQNVISNIDENIVNQNTSSTISNTLSLVNSNTSDITSSIKKIGLNSNEYKNHTFANASLYSSWTNFNTYFTIETIDNIPRIPILKFVNFDYVIVTKEIDVDTDSINSINIYDYITPINDLIKSKLEFKGMNIEDDGFVEINSSGQNILSVVNAYDGGNYQVTLNVETKNYNIVFNANGGVGTMNNINAISNYDVLLNKNTFTRVGYTFNGWNTLPDGTGNSYKDMARLNLDMDDNSTLTLYAMWKLDYIYKSSKYSINNTKKYIDLIPYDTTASTFKKNILINSDYTLKLDIYNKLVVYTGSKTRIYKGTTLVYEFTNIVRGDINGDAQISAMDYIRIRNHMMGKSIIKNEIELLAADANNDSKISALDYITIKKIIMAR